MLNKTCIIIAGPTASGKTATAIRLAKQYSTEIISADSRQCFRELNIGVAKPSPASLQTIPHHFINSHSIHENISVADFEKVALNAAEIIFKVNNVAVLTGGTGLYIHAFVKGIDAIPAIDPEIREQVKQDYKLKGFDWLSKELKEHDPAFAEQGEMQNPQRMMRALEVFLATGKSILSFQNNLPQKRNFNIIQFGLEVSRDELYNRINNRVDEMMNDGLLQEATTLLPFRHLNALQTVGYRELFDFFENKITREKAFELIKQNSRHYAKRQLTWFKKDEEIVWLKQNEILAYLMNSIRE